MAHSKILFVCGTLALLLAAVSQIAAAQCVETDCHSLDFDTCHGWQGSLGAPCHRACECGAMPTSYLDSLHPGLFLDEQGGKLVVSAVLPQSPAAAAGVLAGDEVRLINGRVPESLPCDEGTWAFKDSGTASVVVRHGDQDRTLVLQLVPIRWLLAAQWSNPARGIRVEDVRLSAAASTRLLHSDGMGIEWSEESGSFLITRTLRGSPAERAGLLAGDKILEVDGVSGTEAGHRLLKVVVGEQVALTIRRGPTGRTMTVTSQGMSALLRASALSSLPSELASAAAPRELGRKRPH